MNIADLRYKQVIHKLQVCLSRGCTAANGWLDLDAILGGKILR